MFFFILVYIVCLFILQKGVYDEPMSGFFSQCGHKVYIANNLTHVFDFHICIYK